MKSVLISIRPQWCEKILNGKKTIEVRKSAPKEVPFKAFIYCTKDKPYLYCDMPIKEFYLDNGGYKGGECNGIKLCNGKVIGEFICDKVYRIEPIFSFYESYSGYDDSSDFSYFEDYSIDSERLKKTCLTRQELYIYGKGKTLYGWHISDLKLYDKPKKLNEFKTPPCEKPDCGGCKYRVVINTPETYEIDCFAVNGREITRPPQSYMFVEEVEQ